MQVNIGTLAVPATGETAVLRGTNLGGTIGAATSNLVVTTPNLVGGAGAGGTFTDGIRPDILGDTNATAGVGTGFVTSVATTGFRTLNTSTELTSSLSQISANTNVALGASTNLAATTPFGSLTLKTGSGITSTDNAPISARHRRRRGPSFPRSRR